VVVLPTLYARVSAATYSFGTLVAHAIRTIFVYDNGAEPLLSAEPQETDEPSVEDGFLDRLGSGRIEYLVNVCRPKFGRCEDVEPWF